MELNRVVITGLGSLTPLGNNISELWNGLSNGVSGADKITRFDASQFKTQIACELKNFNQADYFDRKEARKYDLFSMYAMIGADQAIVDSALDLEKVNKENVGVIWASGIGGITSFQKEVGDFYKGDGRPRFNPFFIPKMIADIAAGHISIKHGFMGLNFGTISACASSANAIADAANYIRLGKIDVVVTGGSEASVIESGIGGFSSMQAISKRNDDPKTASRPFDKDRDGFVLGEGSGAMVIESLDHAKARGAKIYAEIVGCGLSADAYHLTAPHPEGNGAKLAMRKALKEANLELTDVDHINTHGTSTPVGDIAEIKAIDSLFGEHAAKLLINSTKSMTGHLLGAAGVIESIAAVLAMNNSLVPPTINHFTDDPEIPSNPNIVYNKAQKADLNVVMSNAFGFGGHNTSLVFKKYSE
jgi:3-oxoacyl-[acyl-carrier-protein] synthase II